MKIKTVTFLALSFSATVALGAGETNSSQITRQQIYDTMNNSTGITGGFNWANKLSITGFLAVNSWRQTDPNIYAVWPDYEKLKPEAASNVRDISAMALNLDANLTKSVATHLGLFYASPEATQPKLGGIAKYKNNSFNVFSSRYYDPNQDGTLVIDDAYLTIGDFSKNPFMLRIGQQYLAFGQYNRYAPIPSLTQSFTELRENAIQLSYVNKNGFQAAGFIFPGLKKRSAQNTQSETAYNYGGSLAYTGKQAAVSYHLSAGYLYNILDVGTFYHALTAPFYVHAVSAWTAHADAGIGPYTFSLDHFQTIGRLNGVYDWWVTNSKSGDANYTAKPASPTANTLKAAYHFKLYGKDNALTASYQWATEASIYSFEYNNPYDYYGIINLPETRYSLSYNLKITPHFGIDAHLINDQAFARKYYGTGWNNTTLLIGLSAGF